MIKTLNTNSFYTLAVLTLVLAVLTFRFLPHEANLSPVLAIALFSGSWFSRPWIGGVAALVAIALSDLFLGFHSTIPYVYGSIILCSVVGASFKRKSESLVELGLASLTVAVVFYVITNFGVWASTAYYPKTWQGLVDCYTLALPFFRNSIIGTFAGGFILFAGERLIRATTIQLQPCALKS